MTGEDVELIERRAARFLLRESQLLDDRRYEEWLALLRPDFYYSLPLPLVREDPFLPRYHHRGVFFEATRTGLELKLGRMHERTAWSDRPHSATRRYVSSILVESVDRDADTGAVAAEVRSNVLVAVVPAGQQATLTTAGRVDRLAVEDDGTFALIRRTVHLDVEVPTDVQLSVVF